MRFDDKRHQIIYDYWLEKKGDRKAPSRADIDPVDLPQLLPNIFLFDVFHDPLDFRMRLAGTRIVQVMEKDCTGMSFDEIYKDDRVNKLRVDYTKATLEFEPVYSEVSAGWMNRDYLTYFRLLLPLSSDGVKVNMLLGYTTFTKAGHRR